MEVAETEHIIHPDLLARVVAFLHVAYLWREQRGETLTSFLQTHTHVHTHTHIDGTGQFESLAPVVEDAVSADGQVAAQQSASLGLGLVLAASILVIRLLGLERVELQTDDGLTVGPGNVIQYHTVLLGGRVTQYYIDK